LNRIATLFWPLVLFGILFAPSTSLSNNIPPPKPNFDPIPHINQFPTLQPLTNLIQFNLQAPSAGKTNIRHTQSYSSTNYFQDFDRLNLGQDMEQFRHRTDIALRITQTLTIQLSQALIYGWNGFMDPFLNWYHKSLSLPNYGREDRPSNRYLSYARDIASDRNIAPSASTLYLTDPVIGAFFRLRQTPQTHTDVGLHVQIPVGSVRGGISTGATDVALSLAHTAQYAKVSLFGKMVLLRPGSTTEPLYSRLRTHAHLFAASEYHASEVSSWLVQFNYMQSPFTRYQNHFISGDPVEVIVAYRRRFDAHMLTVAFSEDPALPATDFTVSVSWQKKF